MCVDDQGVALDDKYCEKNRKPKERDLCRNLPLCAEELNRNLVKIN